MHVAGTISLVTGGAGGIGRAIASALHDAGGTVVTADLPGVRAVEKRKTIVAPGRASLLWRIARFSPKLVEFANGKAMRDELQHT